MANLSNCSLCGSREHPSDLHLIGGRYLCRDCEEQIPGADEGWNFDDVARYVGGLSIAEPLNIHGTGPLDPALR